MTTADQRPCTCDPTGLGHCPRHGDGAGVPDPGRPVPLPPPPRALRAAAEGDAGGAHGGWTR